MTRMKYYPKPYGLGPMDIVHFLRELTLEKAKMAYDSIDQVIEIFKEENEQLWPDTIMK